MPSELETAMETIINIFQQYSIRVDGRYQMSKKELKELLQNELGDRLKTPRDPKVMDKIMRDLDENPDGPIIFDDFVMLVSAIIMASNTSFSEET